VLLRKSVPYVRPDGWVWTGPRHRRPSLLATAWAQIRGAL
jgi:hypothetical protein